MVVLLILVTSLYWAQSLRSSDQLRQETLAQARLRAMQVNSATAQTVSALFRTIDVLTLDLAEEYRSANKSTFNVAVEKLLKRLPPGSVFQVATIGADGYVEYSNLGLKDRVYLGDREHFKVHLEGKEDHLFVSKPLLGRVSKQWSIQFSRPIRQGERLLGVIVVSLSPNYLTNGLAELGLDSDDSISIVRHSGEFLARNRNHEEALGRSVAEDRPYLSPQTQHTGSFIDHSSLDGIERYYHWRRLEDYPVSVVLGLSIDKVLKPVNDAITRDRFEAMMFTLMLWVIALSLLLLSKHLRQNRAKQREVEYAAHHDSLTGLANRRALKVRLGALIDEASACNATFGVLYLDLNNFKPVNDTYGHATGDEVLKAVAGRIKGCMRETDFAARIGGDEFVIVVRNVSTIEEAESLKQRIAVSLNAPIKVGSGEILIGASIGIAIYPEDGKTQKGILESADRAMYRTKVDFRHAAWNGAETA